MIPFPREGDRGPELTQTRETYARIMKGERQAQERDMKVTEKQGNTNRWCHMA